MVRIRDYSEEEGETTTDDTTEEEDDETREGIDLPPVPPDPPDPPLVPEAAVAPPATAQPATAQPATAQPATVQPATVQPPAEEPQPQPQPRVLTPIRHEDLSRQYIWYLLRKYGQSIEFSRSMQDAHGPAIAEGLNKWAAELRQLVGPSNGHGAAHQFVCSISTPVDTASSTAEENVDQEPGPSVAIATCSLHATEEIGDVDTDNKTESDGSAREKSNGVGEKELIASLEAAKADLLSSPDLSDYELSEVSDSMPPPDYETVQAEEADKNQEQSSALTECPWSKVLEQASSAEELDPELTESADGREPSEASEEDGEAAALPASAVVKDCWEEWIDDVHLFHIPSEIPKPPSPKAEERSPSPTSPTTARRSVKLENRNRVRQAAKALSRFIFVPTEKIGRIVGKGGRRIREIEERTNTKIRVEHKKSSKPVTQITLTGTDADICKADEEICMIIRNFKPPKSGEATTASVSSFEELELKRLLIGIKNQVLDGEKRCRKPAD